MTSKKNRPKENQANLQKVRKENQIQKSGAIRKDAHVSSRNKREQGKRDEHLASNESA